MTVKAANLLVNLPTLCAETVFSSVLLKPILPFTHVEFGIFSLINVNILKTLSIN